mgnify:CR=1 FL=1
MFAPALYPAKNNLQMSSEHFPIELVRLTPSWQDGLSLFFQALKETDEQKYFSPHPTDTESLRKVTCSKGEDLYYVLVEGRRVLGYGLLRGWDEGYVIPSLGLAIHPSARGTGLGRFLIDFLHILAIRKGATKVRLRVNVNNQKDRHLI